ncbi:type II secretion system protein J [Candidatus Omnitrophota bacterium]
MLKKQNKKRGITLIEVLLAASIMTFVGVGVYRTFCSGISVWRWLHAQRPSADALIFFDKVAFDMRNYCDVSTVAFQGSAHKLSFYVHNTDYLLLSSKELVARKNVSDDAIVRVEYVFIPEKKEIRRRTYKFGVNTPEIDLLNVSDVKELRFVFYVKDPAENFPKMTYALEGQAPEAIKITLELPAEQEMTTVLQKIIEVPVNS